MMVGSFTDCVWGVLVGSFFNCMLGSLLGSFICYFFRWREMVLITFLCCCGCLFSNRGAEKDTSHHPVSEGRREHLQHPEVGGEHVTAF